MNFSYPTFQNLKNQAADLGPVQALFHFHFFGRPDRQNLFPIVQGGLDVEKRKLCAAELTERAVPGFAVGGLSGGEAKDSFWRMVHVSTSHLPEDKPRYLMGVGFALDLVVCSALGVDMYDCVFPTR